MAVPTTPEFETAGIRDAVIAIHPELAEADFQFSAGWDCVAADAGDRLIFKFPRDEAAAQRLRAEATLLETIRSFLTMPVPALVLHAGPPLFSEHVKLKGGHLVAAQYETLPECARARLAADLALFYAELHERDASEMERAGAVPIGPWLDPDDILKKALPPLPSAWRDYAARIVEDWRNLEPDPHGTCFGFFDGHGWNMAFDHASQRLNGIYDFGDSGFGPLTQDFIYSNWISPDLTTRIADRYEGLTGRRIDRPRIDLLTAVQRLSELAEHAYDPQHRAAMIENVIDWGRRYPAA